MIILRWILAALGALGLLVIPRLGLPTRWTVAAMIGSVCLYMGALLWIFSWRSPPVSRAEKRARRLLRAHLSPAQLADFVKSGYFAVPGLNPWTSQPTIWWLGPTGPLVQQDTVLADGFEASTKVHFPSEVLGEDLPSSDVLLLQKVTIEAYGRLPRCGEYFDFYAPRDGDRRRLLGGPRREVVRCDDVHCGCHRS